MNRLFFAVTLAAISLSACAQPATPAATNTTATGASADSGDINQRVREKLKELEPNYEPSYIGAAPFPGFREVLMGGQSVYVSDDGQYLLQGSAINLKTRQVAVSTALSNYRKEQIAQIPKSDRIIFAPANPKYTVAVFTDVECGYCRKLHQEIPEFNKLGIAIEYLAFPRMGLGSPDHEKMISVWCATDRKKALTDAKQEKTIPSKNCTNPITMHYKLGQSLGISGTPAIFADDGTMLGGYLPPQQLRDFLDKHFAKTAVTP